MNKIVKRILIALGAFLGIIVLVVGGYVIYVVASYSRIEDNLALTPENASDGAVRTGEEYTVVTQNLGFGAYTADFTFFMDGGKESRARSADSVKACVSQGAEKVRSFDPDFAFFQEVDTGSTRSYDIDEREIVKSYFEGFSSAFAVNYRSAYLFYPIFEPHGASNSGMLTLSKSAINSATRRSLPISTGMSKFLDLDRCYSVSRVPVEGGKELVLVNVHLSAYGGSDEIRAAQMNMVLGEIQAEYDKGNYCVVGGDFNHDFTGDSTQKLNGGEHVDFGWAMPFPTDMLSEYPAVVHATDYSDGLKPTCRNCDVPYKEGNFTIIVDGFLVSKNVRVTYLDNVVTGFAYSDHNPVVMKFTLL